MRDPDGLTAYTAAERPDLDERAAGLAAAVWPEYNRHGDVLNAHWHVLHERYPALQFVLVDGDEDPVAQGHLVPCRWNGTPAGLPDGIDGVMAAPPRAWRPPTRPRRSPRSCAPTGRGAAWRRSCCAR